MDITFSIDTIATKILVIRGKKVMLDRDLASLYGVETRVLNQAVRRNRKRFPSDFMFQLNKKEFKNWKSQFVTSNRQKMGIRRKPYVFTEQGVAMLSGVLNSQRAISVNILIMRAFVKMREFVSSQKYLAVKIQELEEKYAKHDENIKLILESIRQLLQPPAKQKPRIGFRP